MSYCLNPACLSPHNGDVDVCQSCGTELTLCDRYRVLKPIGQGGFGRTFLAVDLSASMKPRCAIKQLYPQQKGSEEKASDLFRQEAQQLKLAGQYPSIPTFLDYFEQEGFQYLVQEYIEGQNLAEILATGRHFTESEVKVLLETMLETLDFLHNHQIIHRDIKPANIIQTLNERFVLVDLGAAKLMTGTALGQTGTVIGSAEYVAPEQLRGKAIFASDLYSLGATCVTLLTGMSPFSLFDTSTGSWEWRDYLVQNPVSDSLGQVLDRLLIGPTKQRYASADEVLGDLIVKKPELVKENAIDPWHESFVEAEERSDEWRLPFQEAAPTPELGIERQPPGEIVGKGSDRLHKRLNLTILLFSIGAFILPIGALIIGKLGSIPPSPRGLTSDEINRITDTEDGKRQQNSSTVNNRLSDLIKPDHTQFIKPHKAINNLPLFSSIVIRNNEEIILGGLTNQQLKIWNLNINTGSSSFLKLSGSYPKNVQPHPEIAINNDFLLYSATMEDNTKEIKAWNMEDNESLPIMIAKPNKYMGVHLEKSGLIRVTSPDGSIHIWNILEGGKIQISQKINLQSVSTSTGTIMFTRDASSMFTLQETEDFANSRVIQKNIETGRVMSSFSPAEIGTPITNDSSFFRNLFTISQSQKAPFLIVSTQTEIPGIGTSIVTDKLSKLNPYTRGTPGYHDLDLRQVGLSDSSVFHVFDIKAKKVLHSFSRPGKISHIAISPDSKTLVIVESKKLTVWDVKTGRFLREMSILEKSGQLWNITEIGDNEMIEQYSNRVSLNFTPNSKKLVLGVSSLGSDGTPMFKGVSPVIYLWNVDELRNP
jgi:serine/threonine protein kinase